MNNIWFIIPAREGSKGFPFKNRHLFDYTAKEIPKLFCSKTIVTTNDLTLIERAKEYNFQTLQRSEELSADDTSMKAVVSDVISRFQIPHEDDVIVLYLTYPQRTYNQIKKVYDFYLSQESKSLLCKKEAESHPYLCYYEEGHNRGTKVIEHDLYRRQDYPNCFQVSHYMIIFKSGLCHELDNNLYHFDTRFYPLNDPVYDIDYKKNFEDFTLNVGKKL
tara:strand:+ start:499 stop:1155 length:657 start_codon:yes stop_codon:yes gene_type:complete